MEPSNASQAGRSPAREIRGVVESRGRMPVA